MLADLQFSLTKADGPHPDFPAALKNITTRLEIARGELSDLQERADWSRRMAAKGLMSNAQAAADANCVDAARLALHKLEREWYLHLGEDLKEATSRVESARADLGRLTDSIALARALPDKGPKGQAQIAKLEQQIIETKLRLIMDKGQRRFLEAQAAVQKIGANLLFCDGTVRLTLRDLDLTLLRALITPNGGEAFDMQWLKKD